MKTKELTALKEEKTVNGKRHELTPEEMEQITGGLAHPQLDISKRP